MRRARTIPWALLLVLAGLLAYANSFKGPFIFDDLECIRNNPYLHHLWPLTDAISYPVWSEASHTLAGRPVVSLTFALNYALSGYDVWSYHLVNLLIHLANGLLVFGLVRQTLATPRLKKEYASSGSVMAFSVALLWTVHPLTTASVTYIIQRAESLSSLFYLLTMYCAARGFRSERGAGWHLGAAVSCLVGVGCKETVVTAPLMVFLYDYLLVTPGTKETLRHHRNLYIGLCSSWLVLALLMSLAPRLDTVGFGFRGMPPLRYLLNQGGVILHYLHLSVWPDPLVLDYLWPQPRGLLHFLPGAALVAALVIWTAVAVTRRLPSALMGAWFFVLLAPTSSFVPVLTEVAAEHRMYLPLIAPLCVVVMAGSLMLSEVFKKKPVLRSRVGGALVVALALTFAVLTHARNRDYRSTGAIWQDTARKQPWNPRALHNLGIAYAEIGKYQDALGFFDRALSIRPDFLQARMNRAVALARLGDADAALAEAESVLALDPERPDVHRVLGQVYLYKGDFEQAKPHFRKALELQPQDVGTMINVGTMFVSELKYDEAIPLFERAVALDGTQVMARYNLGVSCWRVGRVEEAREHLARAKEMAGAAGNYGLVDRINKVLAEQQPAREDR